MSITIKQLINIIRESIDEMPGFHGSGADFDRFNHKKHLGSGCGSQAFGWGTYVTDDRAIGDSYAENALELNDIPDYLFNDGSIIWGPQSISSKLDIPEKECFEIYKMIDKDFNNIDSSIKRLKSIFKSVSEQGTSQSYLDELNTWINDLEKLKQGIKKTDKSDIKSYLYHVDIPDDNGSNYLDWYGEINDDIINKVVDGFDRLSKKYMKMIYAQLELILWYQNHGEKINKEKEVIYNYLKDCKSGKDLYSKLELMLGSQKAASLYLLNCCGIIGIKYESGTKCCRPNGAREDGHNYVLFDINSPQITDKEIRTMV